MEYRQVENPLSAKAMYERIKTQVRRQEADAGPRREGLRIEAILADGRRVEARSIGFEGPSLIIIDGIELEVHDNVRILLAPQAVQIAIYVHLVGDKPDAPFPFSEHE